MDSATPDSGTVRGGSSPEAPGARTLRVCYFGTWRPAYSRNLIMIQSLREQGVPVHECHAGLWRGIPDRVRAASGGWLRPAFIGRLLLAGLKLIRTYLASPRHDIVVVGYPGMLDVYLAKVLATLRGVPLVWDVFMSPYLVAKERGIHERSPFTARVLKAVEGVALRLPNRLIQDTALYVRWLHRTHLVPEHRFRLVPTGADDRVFRPDPGDRASTGMTVLYYGSFIPNHGVPYILDAAASLSADADLRFVLIGDGPEREEAERVARERGLINVTFRDWMPREELAAHIGSADVCLGAFGETPQSLMTVQNKTYECLAMRKAVITGDSAAIRAQFRDREQLITCARHDGRALAGAIRELIDDPALRERVAIGGHREFRARYSLSALGLTFRDHLEEEISRVRRERR